MGGDGALLPWLSRVLLQMDVARVLTKFSDVKAMSHFRVHYWKGGMNVEVTPATSRVFRSQS
jgi:hypothetical protein